MTLCLSFAGLLRVAVVLAMLAWVPATVLAKDGYAVPITGHWRLTAALDGADIASLDEREARELIGRVFIIDSKSVRFGNWDCGPSDFYAISVEPKMFLREQFHADASRLGLPNPVTMVDLSCTSVFIKSGSRLVIAWKGWFFDAVRITPPPR